MPSIRYQLHPLASLLLLITLIPGPVAALALPEIESDRSLSREGYFVLTWQGPDGIETLDLQQSSASDFHEARSWTVPATGALTLTGLGDGLYHFRVGSSGTWSDPVTVRVEHHALSRALLFFGVGLILFLSLVVAVLGGAARLGREDRG